MQFSLTGCFTRAHHFSLKLTEILRKEHGSGSKNFDYPFKHFLFGIFARTVDAGTTIWRYHVAPIVKLGDGELHILDPVVHHEPMKKEDYHSELGSELNKAVDAETGTEVTSKVDGFVTCNPDTYEETDDCFNSTPDDIKAKNQQIVDQTKLYLTE